MHEHAHHPMDAERARALFNERKLRCTSQRLGIFCTLARAGTHPTAEELHRLVREQGDASVSRATIYNTLEALEHAGLVRRIPTNIGARYDASPHRHVHIVLPCGSVRDAPEELGRALLEAMPERFRAYDDPSSGALHLHVMLVAEPTPHDGD